MPPPAAARPPREWLREALEREQARHGAVLDALNERYHARLSVRADYQTYAGIMLTLLVAGSVAILGLLVTAAVIPAWMAILLTAAVTLGAMGWCAINPSVNPIRAQQVAERERQAGLVEESARHADAIHALAEEYTRRLPGGASTGLPPR